MQSIEIMQYKMAPIKFLKKLLIFLHPMTFGRHEDSPCLKYNILMRVTVYTDILCINWEYN
jgi:hypothetical protein